MSHKWNLQDIRPSNAKQAPVQNIPARRPAQDISARPPRIVKEEIYEDPDLGSIDIVDGKSAKRKRVFVTSAIALLIIGVGFFVNVLLGGADVTVYPKIKDVSVQSNFTVFTKPQSEELGYELLTLEATGEKQVKAAGKETVSERAEGKIFVYNTKSPTPQRLIKNTRFETSDGLIYKIKESIEVPAASKDAKGNFVPGSVVADVFADGTGEKYNIAPTRFTVPGLKGSEQYDSIYGESTAAFTGGFEGEKYIIDENELSTAKQALHIELRDKLLARLKEERPAGFIVYDDSVTFAYDSLPATEYGESLATIKEKARLQVPMFKETEFSKYIAEKSIPDYTGEPVTMPEPQTLVFSYTSGTTSVSDISGIQSLDITLKGNVKIVWKFDEKKLQEELIGIKKTDATNVFSGYTSISHAQAEVRPFWTGSFPNSIDNIRINTVIEPQN